MEELAYRLFAELGIDTEIESEYGATEDDFKIRVTLSKNGVPFAICVGEDYDQALTTIAINCIADSAYVKLGTFARPQWL